MNRYAVYQVPFDSPFKRDLMFSSVSEIEAASDQYELVAEVDARSLDEVFRIGNFIVESDSTLINVLSTEMCSISVGDIIHNLETDETYLVQDMGYTKINMKESV